MTLVQAKQIKKWFDAYVPLNALSVTYVATPIADINISTEITVVLATAGEGGVAVPVQPGTPATQIGVRADAPNNKVELFNNVTQKKINDGSGNEVYGRITEALGVYTLTFYSMIAGVETAYSFVASVDIDCEFLYLFDLYRCPANTQFHVRRSYDDLNVGGGTKIIENIDVLSLNTLDDLGYAPVTGSVLLFVNKITEDALAPAAFTVTGVNLAWSEANAGYALETTDKVTAEYLTYAI